MMTMFPFGMNYAFKWTALGIFCASDFLEKGKQYIIVIFSDEKQEPKAKKATLSDLQYLSDLQNGLKFS